MKLTKIDYDIFHDVIELQLYEGQEHYLPSNVYSIAESSFSASFHPRAICLSKEVVGFLMYELVESAGNRHLCTIWRFMVDRRHQCCGIGKAAMNLLMEEIKTCSQCKVVEVYYDLNNTAAKRLYTRYGFKVVGKREDGDVIAEVAL